MRAKSRTHAAGAALVLLTCFTQGCFAPDLFVGEPVNSASVTYGYG